jgi:hypothetical protein
VEFACAHQPVPPEGVPGLPFRPVVLEGMTVQPRAEASGQAKWLTWVVRAVGMTAPGVTSGTLDDHRAERSAFVRQLLHAAGIQPAHGVVDGSYVWERTAPADPDVPPRPVLLLRAVAERQRWKAEYAAAQLAVGELPDNCSATDDQAA